MNIIDLEDIEDGSAILSLELTKEEVELFLSDAIRRILIEAAERITAIDGTTTASADD